MIAAMVLVAGFLFPQVQAGTTSCVDVLHQLRSQHHLEVVSAETVHDEENGDAIVYLLTEDGRLHKKTAEVVCRFGESTAE